MASSRIDQWKKARWRRSPIVPVLGLGWLAIVTIFLVWQTVSYRGIPSSFAELQYAQLGQSFPVLSLIPLVSIFGLPGLLLLWVRLPRDRKGEAVPPALVRTVVAERQLLRILTVSASLMLVITVTLLIGSLFQPNDTGIIHAVDARSTTAPGEGHTRLTGTIAYERTATFEQDILFLHRAIRFAPVIVSSDLPVRYFVEITPERLRALELDGATKTFDGILQHDGLPGPVKQLFRYAGFRLETPHYVLFASRMSVRIPLYVMALNALIAAICLAFLAFYQRYRFRKAQDVAIQAQSPTPITS